MKKILVFITAIAAVACTKETLPTNTPEVKNLITLGGKNTSVQFDSIVDPTPTKIAAGDSYEFELFPDILNNWDLKIGATSISDTIDGVLFRASHITIEADYIIAQSDTSVEIMSKSLLEDSLAIVTSHSIYPSFQNVISTYKRSFQRPTWFTVGNSINIDEANWVRNTGMGTPLFTTGGTLYARQLFLDESPSYPSYNFTVKDRYFPLMLGQSHKIIVFKSILSTAPGKTESKIGWIELSIDENAKLTIHKVVYQVD